MSDGIFMLSLSLSSCLRVSDPSTTELEVTLVMAQNLQCRRIARSHWWRRHDAHKAVSCNEVGSKQAVLSVFMSCSEICGVVPYAVTWQMSLVLEGLVRVGSIRACPNRSPVWLPICGFFPLVELFWIKSNKTIAEPCVQGIQVADLGQLASSEEKQWARSNFSAVQHKEMSSHWKGRLLDQTQGPMPLLTCLFSNLLAVGNDACKIRIVVGITEHLGDS